MSEFNTYFLSFTFSSVTVATVLTGLHVDGLEWLDLLYLFSYIKLYISFAKYLPQVSTPGSSVIAQPFFESDSAVITTFDLPPDHGLCTPVAGVPELQTQEHSRLVHY